MNKYPRAPAKLSKTIQMIVVLMIVGEFGGSPPVMGLTISRR